MHIELPNSDWSMIKVGRILIEENIPDWDKINRLKLIYKDYLEDIEKERQLDEELGLQICNSPEGQVMGCPGKKTVLEILPFSVYEKIKSPPECESDNE